MIGTMFRTYATALAVAGALLMAGAAGATQPTVVDQYTEQAPTPGGDKPSKEVNPGKNSHEGGGGGDSSAVPGGTAGSGTGGGSSGSTSETTGGGPAQGGAGDSSEAAGGNPRQADSLPGTGGGSTGTIEGSGSDGMGLLFPLILLGCLVVIGAIFVGRRRAGSQAA